jgi:hypothetical protein
MKDDKMLNYIKSIKKHASWLVKYNNHRLDIYDEKLAKQSS